MEGHSAKTKTNQRTLGGKKNEVGHCIYRWENKF